MTTYRLQAEWMIREHGKPEALKRARLFSIQNGMKRDKENQHFWLCVAKIIEDSDPATLREEIAQYYAKRKD